MEKLLGVNTIIDNVVTSGLVRMCVFGFASYHCHNWRERFVPLYRATAGLCGMSSILIMDVIILFPRQTRVYMLLSEGLLI